MNYSISDLGTVVYMPKITNRRLFTEKEYVEVGGKRYSRYVNEPIVFEIKKYTIACIELTSVHIMKSLAHEELDEDDRFVVHLATDEELAKGGLNYYDIQHCIDSYRQLDDTFAMNNVYRTEAEAVVSLNEMRAENETGDENS